MRFQLKSFGFRYERERITTFIILSKLFLLIFLLPSCKNKETAQPQIFLTTGAGYAYSDVMMKCGGDTMVGINADFGGDANITNLIIRNEHDGIVTSYFDTGINNESIKISKILTKGVYDSEKWTFIAVDKNGGTASVSFIMAKDPNSECPNFKQINATLGAQKSTLFGSFLSLHSGLTFFQDAAFLIQDSIEMLYYYDNTSSDAHTIASPNANVDPSIYTGTSGLVNWTVKNETRYYKTTLTLADFNAASNGLLLTSYAELLAKRKAKNLAEGDIYSFKTAHNKYGLFHVQQVTGQDTGSVTINILVQE